MSSRQTDFTYPDTFDPVWVRRLPELACAANAVSLLMPYVEPYVARSISKVRPQLNADLAIEARAYVRQESSHHREHKRFNSVITSQVRGLTPLLRVVDWSYTKLDRRGATFGVAFAAGFETVAFAAARWVDARANLLFIGADPVPSSLFLWHLAEEAEHRSVAFNVMKALEIKRSTYALAMVLSALMLACFVVPLTIVSLWNARRLFHPLAHVRLLWWTLTFLMELVPDMMFSLSSKHDPGALAEPEYLATWLADFDANDVQAARDPQPNDSMNSGLLEKPSMTSPRDNPESSLAVQ